MLPIVYDMVQWEKGYVIKSFWCCRKCKEKFDQPGTYHDCPKSNNGQGVLGDYKNEQK